MKKLNVKDRIVQFANRYKLKHAGGGAELGTFDFDEATGTVTEEGTEINKELFDTIDDNFDELDKKITAEKDRAVGVENTLDKKIDTETAKKVNLSGGELKDTVTTFSDYTTDNANIASGEKTSVIFGKIKRWFSRLKALAFKSTVGTADIDNNAITSDKIANGTIKREDLSDDAQSAMTKADNAVLTTTQTLTDVQKSTARTNLGLGSLATKNTIISSDITDGTIVNTDINANAAIDQSKISGLVTALSEKATVTALNEVKATADAAMPKAGGTFSGNISVATNATINTSGHLIGTWLKITATEDLKKAADKIAVLDSVGWVYYRTPAEILSDIGAYSKPSDGIPASDLAGGIPTSKITGLPTSLPPSGNAGGDLIGTYPNPTVAAGKITKAKLDSSVQTSLGKADTALQSVPTASTTVLGGVKLGSDTVQSVAMGSPSTAASRTYPIQKNGSGQLVVNVPWQSSSYTLPAATEDTLGGIRLGDSTQFTATFQNLNSRYITKSMVPISALMKNSSNQGGVIIPSNRFEGRLNLSQLGLPITLESNDSFALELSTADKLTTVQLGNILAAFLYGDMTMNCSQFYIWSWSRADFTWYDSSRPNAPRQLMQRIFAIYFYSDKDKQFVNDFLSTKITHTSSKIKITFQFMIGGTYYLNAFMERVNYLYENRGTMEVNYQDIALTYSMDDFVNLLDLMKDVNLIDLADY